MPILSKEGIPSRKVVDFKGKEGLNWELNDGVFIKKSTFPESMASLHVAVQYFSSKVGPVTLSSLMCGQT